MPGWAAIASAPPRNGRYPALGRRTAQLGLRQTVEAGVVRSLRSGRVATTAEIRPPGDDPLVLVALSSTFQDQAALLRRVVAALATLPVRGLVTTGPSLDPGAVQGAPNVSVVASAPHRAVLREAALVVTHGGHGTLLKALAADVPVVVLPHGRDQGDNAVRVTLRGAGVALRRTASTDQVARAVRRVLEDPAYARRAAVLGAAVRHDAEHSTLVAELEAGEG